MHSLLSREANANAECEIVGEGQADIAGIGIIAGFVGQAIISLSLACWVFLLSKHGRLEIRHDLSSSSSSEHDVDKKRLECVSDILMVGNDIQMLLGSSLMITVFAAGPSLDLYHLHLVFDIVSFVGPSSAAALICWTFCNAKLSPYRAPPPPPPPGLSILPRSPHWTPRHRAVYAFSIMYLALLVLACVRLGEWAPADPRGRCYHARLLTSSSAAAHPTPDRLYVALTGAWNLAAMLAAALLAPRWRHSVLVAAVVQFPLHLYAALALRAANQGRLEGGEAGEDGWDFGQTTAVVLLGMSVREVYTKGWELYVFSRDVRARRKREEQKEREEEEEETMARRKRPGITEEEEEEEAERLEDRSSDEDGRLEEGTRFVRPLNSTHATDATDAR